MIPGDVTGIGSILLRLPQVHELSDRLLSGT